MLTAELSYNDPVWERKPPGCWWPDGRRRSMGSAAVTNLKRTLRLAAINLGLVKPAEEGRAAEALRDLWDEKGATHLRLSEGETALTRVGESHCRQGCHGCPLRSICEGPRQLVSGGELEWQEEG